jgi:hypothetical protein
MVRYLEQPVCPRCPSPTDRSGPAVWVLPWTLISRRLPLSAAEILSQGVFQ